MAKTNHKIYCSGSQIIESSLLTLKHLLSLLINSKEIMFTDFIGILHQKYNKTYEVSTKSNQAIEHYTRITHSMSMMLQFQISQPTTRLTTCDTFLARTSGISTISLLKTYARCRRKQTFLIRRCEHNTKNSKHLRHSHGAIPETYSVESVPSVTGREITSAATKATLRAGRV